MAVSGADAGAAAAATGAPTGAANPNAGALAAGGAAAVVGAASAVDGALATGVAVLPARNENAAAAPLTAAGANGAPDVSAIGGAGAGTASEDTPNTRRGGGASVTTGTLPPPLGFVDVLALSTERTGLAAVRVCE